MCELRGLYRLLHSAFPLRHRFSSFRFLAVRECPQATNISHGSRVLAVLVGVSACLELRGDAGFFDPAVEWVGVIDDSLGHERQEPPVLADQIHCGDSPRERGYDNRHASLQNEESDCSGD